jgi:putative transcriptional regulator
MISMLPKKGCLLVAEPTIFNVMSFNRSVILLTEHTKDGSVGFILNKPLSYSINDLISEIDANFMVYNGGPVEQNNLYFLHNVPELIPDSVEISYGLYWGGDFETTKNLINEGKISKENIRFFLGYSGWDTNQLDIELEENSWIIVKNELQNKIIAKNSQNFWKEKLNEIGGEYIYFSNSPENPMLN